MAIESHNRINEGTATTSSSLPNLEPVDGREPTTRPLIFIAGVGRSGSTLLDRLLGQVPGWWSLGEIVHLWTRGLSDNERCGCGELFRECEIWNAIGDHAFGGWSQVDVGAVNALRLSVERDRYIPYLLRPGLKPGFRSDVLAYTRILGQIYDAAREVTGATVIVDSGKHVPAALTLRLDPGLDLRVLHLMRDSRGVAYSWSKSVRRPATDGETTMARWSPLESGLRYLGYNTALASVFGRNRLTVKYEALVDDAVSVVDKIVKWVGIGSVPPSVEARSVHLETSHGISGNPMRFAVGEVGLELDDGWVDGLSRLDRAVVTAVTMPTLIQNHYLLAPRSGTGRSTK